MSCTKMTLILFIRTKDHLLRGFGCKILAIRNIIEKLSFHMFLDTLDSLLLLCTVM